MSTTVLGDNILPLQTLIVDTEITSAVVNVRGETLSLMSEWTGSANARLELELSNDRRAEYSPDDALWYNSTAVSGTDGLRATGTALETFTVGASWARVRITTLVAGTLEMHCTVKD